MGYITLLSDLGLKDASVAIARGILLQRAPGHTITDITHELKPFHLGQAAYVLGASYSNFPPGTCHLVLFDIFSEQQPRLVMVSHNGHFFLAADNGLLPAALHTNSLKGTLCLELAAEQSFKDWISAAGEMMNRLLLNGAIPTNEAETILKNADQKSPGNHTHEYHVLHIDEYENVVIDLTRDEYERRAAEGSFSMNVMGVEEIHEVSVNYNDVREGTKLCRFNSAGFMEICINKGRAASLFGLRLGGKHNNIKINFQ